MSALAWAAVAVFTVAYILIAAEWVHRVTAALAGACVMLLIGATDAQRDGWYRYWCDVGFEALETRLARDKATGAFCHGATPTLDDICLVPQLANSRRVNLDLSPYPTLLRIEAACVALPAFANAAPAKQPDAEL